MQNSERISWFEPVFDGRDIEAVNRVVTSGFVNEGPENRAFEKELTEYFDVPYAVTTPNCTTALALALMAHGIGHGDKVLVPSCTFIGTASAVRLAGAEVILVDVDPDTYLMDPDDTRRKVDASVKAIIPVHLTGRPARLKEIKAIADEHKLVVIEDAAEAIGCRDENGWLGTQSDAGCFSLAPTKIITSGQGGFVLTHSEATRDELIRLRDHGRLSRASDLHEFTGFNFKVTDMQAALARTQFAKLDDRIARAKEIDQRYLDALSDCPGISFGPRPEKGYLMWPDFKHERRDELVEHMKSLNIHLRPYWPALHLQPAYRDDSGFPGADAVCRQVCWLPCSPDISNDSINRIASEILNFITK